MRVAIMQPYFFPYLGYFQLISAVDLFVIYDDVNYIKGGWINRNRILSQGRPLRITLNIANASPFTPINETKVTGDYKKLLKTIEQSYAHSSQFKRIFPLLQEVFDQPTVDLCSLITGGLQKTAQVLSIGTPMVLSSQIPVAPDLKGQDRILALCRATGATHYINAIGGQCLYSTETFRSNGLSLSFLQSRAVRYPQPVSEFIPDLSILDVLMHANESLYPDLISAYDLL